MRKRLFVLLTMMFGAALLSLPAAYNLHMVLIGGEKTLQPDMLIQGVFTEPKIRSFFLAFALLAFTIIIAIATGNIFFNYKSGKIRVTPEISIPAAVGQGQYGTAYFLSGDDYKNTWEVAKVDLSSPRLRRLMEEGASDFQEEFNA